MTDPENRSYEEILAQEVTPEELGAVTNALHNPEFDFRTVSGIEREVQIPAERVAAVLRHSGVARESVFRTSEGQAVYASKEQKKTIRERVAEVRWILAR